MLSPGDYMDRALFLAGRGRGLTSPNPLVGAVIVAPDGVIVGWGYHEKLGEAHAEINALAMAGIRARGATMYCTLEPCSHWGRTGPCAPRVVESGISRFVAAMEDPNPKVSGQGFALLRQHGIAVEVGLRKESAIELNPGYLTRMQTHRPFVILKAAISADGYVSEAPGKRTALTSERANRHVHSLRAEVDAIAVGSRTVMADDPLLTVRGVHRARPLTRVIFDRSLSIRPESRVLSTLEAGPVIIVTKAAADRIDRQQALERAGAQVEFVADATLEAALRRLAELGLTSVVLEGGPHLQRIAWDEGLVDYVQLYVTPVVCGPQGVRFLEGHPLMTADLAGRRVRPLGPDVLIEGYVHRAH